MDAKTSPPSMRRRRPWAVHPWTFAVLALLLVAGTLIQACTDNSNTSGPSFSCNENPIERGAGSGSVRSLAACPQSGGKVPVVGDAVGGPAGTLVVTVIVSPAVIDRGRRGSVLVNVTNAHGIGVPGRTVVLTSSGNLDATSGTTDQNGIFTTTMLVPCDIPPAVPPAVSGSVSATVDGVTSVGPFTAITATDNNPCP
jgi:hypothetical protein